VQLVVEVEDVTGDRHIVLQLERRFDHSFMYWKRKVQLVFAEHP